MNDSVRLHRRVREFARVSLEGGQPPDAFQRLALDIARHQAKRNPVVRRLVAHDQAPLDSLESIPAVTADTFRLARVATHPPALDVAQFLTSGTTGGSGLHAFATLETYRELSLAWGGRRLLAHHGFGTAKRPPPVTVVALAPAYLPRRSSSLGFMMQHFMQELDGRALWRPGPFDPTERGRWLMAPAGVDAGGLRDVAELALGRREPVLLLSTALALAYLLNELGPQPLPLPDHSVVMVTGGFKGHRTRLNSQDLASRACELLSLPPERLVGEYGMTELTSQLYDAGHRPGQPSEFVEPPWLRVTPLHPETHLPVADGATGLACFTDLSNVDSAVKVLTQDLVRRQASGVTLLGRSAGARLRGCSLAVDPSQPDQKPPPSPTIAKGPRQATLEQQTRRRLSALAEAAAHLVAPGPDRDRLCQDVVQSTGLSREGVEFALQHALADELGNRASLAVVATPSSRAHVLLPAQVFTAAYRAIAVAIASAERVFVKPSRREPAFARALHDLIPELFEIESELTITAGDHVWLYGSDATAQTLLEQLPPGVILHAHGSGFGVAALRWKPDDEPTATALSRVCGALCQDVVAFDQRGCLSPRFVLVEAEREPAIRLARGLSAELSRWAHRVPRGRLDASERAEEAAYRRCMVGTGEVMESTGSVVALRALLDPSGGAPPEAPSPFDVPPVGRHVEVIRVPLIDVALRRLAPWLTCVSTDDDRWTEHYARIVPSARICTVGRMQRPPLDGPVDRRPPASGYLV